MTSIEKKYLRNVVNIKTSEEVKIQSVMGMCQKSKHVTTIYELECGHKVDVQYNKRKQYKQTICYACAEQDGVQLY